MALTTGDTKQQTRRDFMSVQMAAAYLTLDLKTFVDDVGLKKNKKQTIHFPQ